VAAVKAANVKNVVALSSIGGHLLEGAGIVQGLHDFEEHVSGLKNVNVIIVLDIKKDLVKELVLCMIG